MCCRESLACNRIYPWYMTVAQEVARWVSVGRLAACPESRVARALWRRTEFVNELTGPLTMHTASTASASFRLAERMAWTGRNTEPNAIRLPKSFQRATIL